MRLSDLTAYACEKYNMKEQHKWADFPGFSVLSDPDTGKWVALLMRQWDQDLGEEVERCDIKCGQRVLTSSPAPYFSVPFRMHGPKWLGVTIDLVTDSGKVCGLLDQAMKMSTRSDFTIVLDSGEKKDSTLSVTGTADNDQPDSASAADNGGSVSAGAFNKDKKMQDFPSLIGASQLIPGGGFDKAGPSDPDIPDRVQRMIRMYDYGDGSFRQKCLNFYNQGMFMKDYTDDAPWYGDLRRYFPTYHDLNLKQLRGYFTWRTKIRAGNYEKTCGAFAYIYIYELLNGIGVSSAEESLEKLDEFRRNYLDPGMGDITIKSDLKRWMPEFAVVSGLPQEIAVKYTDRDSASMDAARAALKDPDHHEDDEVFDALAKLSRQKIEGSPAVTRTDGRGKHLFAEVWRLSSSYTVHDPESSADGKDLFTACFGGLRTLPWHPLASAVFFDKTPSGDREYCLAGSRRYIQRNGEWQIEMIDAMTADRNIFRGFMHALDLKLRRLLKTGSYLREKPEEAWAYACIDTAIQEIRMREIEAARPKISIDVSGLSKIREDAAQTRDSLLTKDEQEESEEASVTASYRPEAVSQEEAEPVTTDAGIPYDPAYVSILRALIQGSPVDSLIREHGLMPSVAADSINEAFWDDIGDNIVECENDRLSLVEDYIEDLEFLIGGNAND